MSKHDTIENELLEHFLNNADIPLIGDAGGLRGSVAAGNLYVALHTGDPGEANDQTNLEAAYTGYARAAVARDGTGWTVTGSSASPQADITFPAGTGGGETCTHASVGVASAGASKILYSGALTPNIVTGDGITPKITAGSTIVED